MNKTVMITGASRGIGRAIAKSFAKDGCRLVLNCVKSKESLTLLGNDLADCYGTEVLTSTGNVGDYNYMQSLFSEASDRFGGIDILINNAGISHIGLLQDMTIEEWRRIVDTDLTSVFISSKLAIPYMVSRKSGSIINISSVWGNTGASCEAAYSACKGGVNAMTKALAKELAPSGISVNAIACGVIDTDMNACFSSAEREALYDEIPAGRFGTSDEIAELALSLAKSSPYLTGQVITFDGGWT